MYIETHELVKSFGDRTVVNHVNITVKQGTIVGLLGPNGAGKTTTFYMIVGLEKPDYGTVTIDNRDITHLPMHGRARAGIGYLPQEQSIFRKLTVEENIMSVLELGPSTPEGRQAKMDELIEEFNIEHVRKKVGNSLSGGEKRRVEIARSLATDPSFILLDEPFAGVDPIAVHDLQRLIRHLSSRGIGILITDHNVRETLSIVDQAYILNEGEVLISGDSTTIANSEIARKFYLGENFAL